MKRIIAKYLFALLLAFIGTATYAQENPFDKFADSENLSYTYVSKQMIGLIKDWDLPTNLSLNFNSQDINNLHSVQIISCGKDAIGVLKSEAMSIIKKGDFKTFLQANAAEVKTHIYSKDAKKGCIVVVITEIKHEMVVCVFTYDCQLKDLGIKTTTKYN